MSLQEKCVNNIISKSDDRLRNVLQQMSPHQIKVTLDFMLRYNYIDLVGYNSHICVCKRCNMLFISNLDATMICRMCGVYCNECGGIDNKWLKSVWQFVCIKCKKTIGSSWYPIVMCHECVKKPICDECFS